MKHSTIALILVIVLGLGGFVYVYKKQNEALVISACPADAMMCPDGTSIPRSGPNCEFGVCRQELPAYIREESIPVNKPLASTSPISVVPQKIIEVTKIIPTPFIKVAESVVSFVQQTKKEVAILVPTNKPSVTPSTQVIPAIPSGINEMRYSVQNNVIVDQNNSPIYTLPPGFGNSSGPGSNTHIVNVIPITQTPPVINGIPVNGLPGKYYLSENTLSSLENCKFSNKIYILDTLTNTRTLMYEENNTTLQDDDARSCNSEMYLLATDGNKLILKYHTVGTNMICDSTWSEPEVTWYVNVTEDRKQTRRYFITSTLYEQAEQSEADCRSTLIGTSTPPGSEQTIGG